MQLSDEVRVVHRPPSRRELLAGELQERPDAALLGLDQVQNPFPQGPVAAPGAEHRGADRAFLTGPLLRSTAWDSAMSLRRVSPKRLPDEPR